MTNANSSWTHPIIVRLNTLIIRKNPVITWKCRGNTGEIKRLFFIHHLSPISHQLIDPVGLLPVTPYGAQPRLLASLPRA